MLKVFSFSITWEEEVGEKKGEAIEEFLSLIQNDHPPPLDYC